MMKKCIRVLVFSLAAAFSMVFGVSCAGQLSGSVSGDAKADLYIKASLEPRMTMLIGRLAAASGNAKPGAPIIDGPAVSMSMAAAPGIASVSLKNTSPAAVEGPVKIAKIDDFLVTAKGAQGKTGFITFEQSSQSGRCTINLSLEKGPEILSLISPNISDYLSALMAPLATGEVLTRAEYLALVGSVYGKGIADEIGKAFIRASIDFPGQIQRVVGGTFSGTKAEFSIPLEELLVLEKPLSYEVIWK